MECLRLTQFIVLKQGRVSTLIRMGCGGGGKKGAPTSFSLKISTKIGIISQNFLTLIFNPFATLPQNTKAIPSATPKLLNLNQDHSPQKVVFWSNPYKIEVMITSLIEILELSNLSNMTTLTI